MRQYEIRFNGEKSVFQSCDGSENLAYWVAKIMSEEGRNEIKDAFDIRIETMEITSPGWADSGCGHMSHNDFYGG